jgi:hypothetical protein
LNVDRQLNAVIDPFCVERGSVDNGLARIVPRKAVASTDHRKEPVPVDGALRVTDACTIRDGLLGTRAREIVTSGGVQAVVR